MLGETLNLDRHGREPVDIDIAAIQNYINTNKTTRLLGKVCRHRPPPNATALPIRSSDPRSSIMSSAAGRVSSHADQMQRSLRAFIAIEEGIALKRTFAMTAISMLAGALAEVPIVMARGPGLDGEIHRHPAGQQ